MKKIPQDASVYRMPRTQKAMITLAAFCVHQRDLRIPTCITTEKKLDTALMNRALNLEIARNDALRLFYMKKRGVLYDCFLPSLPQTEFPLADFRGRTDEEMERWLREEAVKPLRYLKGDTYRIFQFLTPEGKNGIYFIVSHASMDLYGVFAFYRDLMAVYDALAEGREMPAPLTRYEDLVKRQLEEERSGEKAAADMAFFAEKFKNDGPSFYAGIDCMKQLNETRRRKRDSTARYIDFSLSDPFNDRSEALIMRIDKEMTDRMSAFCRSSGVSLQNLFYLGMRTYLSSVNEQTDDVYFHFLTHRRKRAEEKRCGGSCTTVLPMRTVIGKGETFASALRLCRKATIEAFRHIDAPAFDFSLLLDKMEGRRKGATTVSMMFTVCPPQAFEAAEGWKVDFSGISTGYFPFIAYAIVLPSPADGGLKCHYEYRPRRFTEQNLRDLHNGTMKVIEAGMNDPDITVEALLNEVLKPNAE